jgi:hypothetical protein
MTLGKKIFLALFVLLTYRVAHSETTVWLGLHGGYDLKQLCGEAPGGENEAYDFYFHEGLILEKEIKEQVGSSYGIHLWEDGAEYDYTCAIEFAPTYADRAYVIYKAWRFEVCGVDETTGEFFDPEYHGPVCNGCEDNAAVYYHFFNKNWGLIANPSKHLQKCHDEMRRVMNGKH